MLLYILQSLRVLYAQLALLFILKIYMSLLFVFKSSVNKSWGGGGRKNRTRVVFILRSEKFSDAIHLYKDIYT